MADEKNGLLSRVGELENRIKELEGEKENQDRGYNDRIGHFTGRIDEIIKKLDNVM